MFQIDSLLNRSKLLIRLSLVTLITNLFTYAPKLDSAFSCLPPEPRFISASPADGEEIAVNGLVVLSYSAPPFVSYRVTVNDMPARFDLLNLPDIRQQHLGYITPVPSTGDQVQIIIEDSFNGETIINYTVVAMNDDLPPNLTPAAMFIKDTSVNRDFLTSCDPPNLHYRRQERVFAWLNFEESQNVRFIKYNGQIYDLPELNEISRLGQTYQEWTLDRYITISDEVAPAPSCTTFNYISANGSISNDIEICNPCSQVSLDSTLMLVERQENREACIHHDLRPYDMLANDPGPEIEVAGEMAGDEAGEVAGTVASEMAGTEAGEIAGTEAGEMAGTEAGEMAGTEAGEIAGTEANEMAGAEFGEMAGMEENSVEQLGGTNSETPHERQAAMTHMQPGGMGNETQEMEIMNNNDSKAYGSCDHHPNNAQTHYLFLMILFMVSIRKNLYIN